MGHELSLQPIDSTHGNHVSIFIIYVYFILKPIPIYLPNPHHPELIPYYPNYV